jgi:hypothetical protein
MSPHQARSQERATAGSALKMDTGTARSLVGWPSGQRAIMYWQDRPLSLMRSSPGAGVWVWVWVWVWVRGRVWVRVNEGKSEGGGRGGQEGWYKSSWVQVKSTLNVHAGAAMRAAYTVHL